jgi:GNAT superfamily N-acetyltransferase
MDCQVQLRALTLPCPELDLLVEEATSAGFPFMETLRREWDDGTNRFDLPGEAYLGVWLAGKLVAAGGINRDPYTDDPQTGRVRHVYVLSDYRRSGVGQILLAEIVSLAGQDFKALRLRTRTSEGAAFYEAIGFAVADEPAATHVLVL